MSTIIPYSPFDKFIYRCPVLPYNGEYNLESNSGLVKEALLLASPDFFEILNREINTNDTLSGKTKQTLLKYVTRMSNRCTPFGLFAGIGVGNVGETSQITLNGTQSFLSHTRLDMNFLCAMIQHIANIPEIAEKLMYYPNSTAYFIMDSCRFVEYSYHNARRRHFLSEVEGSDELKRIFEICANGATITQIAESLSDYEPEEVQSFILSLISNQLLISDLDPAVTGKDLLETTIEKLNRYEPINFITLTLTEINNKLNNIDKIGIGERTAAKYDEIVSLIKELGVPFDRKYLFQTDVSVTATSASLDQNLVDDLKQGLLVLNKLTIREESPILKKFKEDFYKRYEEEEVPLVEVLDSDIGIGFANLLPGNTDMHPLLEGLPLIQKVDNFSPSSQQFNRMDFFLFKKFEESLKQETDVQFTDEELENFPVSWDDLPITFSVMCEHVVENVDGIKAKLHVKSVAGSSAANLMGRFCHVNDEVHMYVKQIVEKENELIPENTLLAEIAHLPESRIGNVVSRPTLRNFEIPYLANSHGKDVTLIPIQDLMVSVKAGRTIKIRSAALGKIVWPRLTTAHNYANNALPVYQFLCMLQTADLRGAIRFSWGSVVGNQPYYPRAIYRNIILSPATWRISAEDTKNIKDSSTNFPQDAIEFKTQKKLPDKVLIASSDNKLLINFNNPDSVRLFFSEIKGKTVILEEYLESFDPNHDLIGDGDFKYKNELILSFFKQNKKD